MNLGTQTSPDAGQRSIRLLLIDDHAHLAEMTAKFLRGAGLEVRIADTGEVALEIALAFRPEIVLCDVRLPDMSGFDVAQALRASGNTKDTLIAMHSAMADSDMRALDQEFKTDAINLFLSKPLTEEKVERLLSELAAHQPR